MTMKRINVLLIEDQPEDVNLFKEVLLHESGVTFFVQPVDRLVTGLERMAKDGADVILLDLFLPDSQGLDTFTKVHLQAPEVPIVVLTAIDDDALALQAVRSGAQDYVVKGETEGKVLSRIIRHAIERHRMQATLRSLSLLDELTGLYNRRGFSTLAKQHLKLAQRTQRGLIFFLGDVDGLKQINDTFGHQVGDLALTETAEVLRTSFRSSDIIARIGGDEFAIIAIEASKDSVEAITARVREQMRIAHTKKHLCYKLSLSLGAVYVDAERRCTVEELIAEADEALYKQKRTRRKLPGKSLR